MSIPTTRRAFLAHGAAFAALIAAAPFADLAPRSARAAAADNADRAARAYDAMQRYFYLGDATELYREQYPPLSTDPPHSYLWAFEEAAKATLHMYGLPNGTGPYGSAVQARLRGREAYWDGQGTGRGYSSYPRVGDRYYDDNDWVGSDLIQHHLLTGDAIALDRARGVFDFVLTGWDTALRKPGGVFWVKTSWNMDRGTGPTGGAARLAVQLYEATGRTNATYLDWARRMYAWTREQLFSKANGLYWDNIRPDGTVVRDHWIYNQGVMIGAAVLLHRVTGAASYLAEARQVADAALAYFGTVTGRATDPYYNRGRGYYSGQGIFNAIFFRNLLLLHAATNDAAYLAKAQAYVDHVWADTRVHAASDLFKFNTASSTYSLHDQAAMVQLYACLGWHPSTYARLT